MNLANYVFRLALLSFIVIFHFQCNIESENTKLNTKLHNEAKWMMYALNFEYPAYPVYYENQNLGIRNLVECDYKESNQYESSDTIEIIYNLYFQHDTVLYRIRGIGFIGLLFVHNQLVYLIPDEFKPDFLDKPDSLKAFIKNQSIKFENFIRSYKGQITPWLENEKKVRSLN